MAGIVLLAPATSLAAETCPWLNAATAAGVLGGPVTATVTHENANRDDAVCRFVQEQGKVTELRIAVQTIDTPRSEFAMHATQCGSNVTPLKAVGNEAVLCSPNEDNSGKRSAQVVGRVRTKIFIILVRTTKSSTTLSSLRDKARDVAEQVAGNLF